MKGRGGLLLAVLLAIACRMTPKQAREELAKLNVPFTSDEFVTRCAQGPTTLVDTFLKAGADPNVLVGDAKSYTPLMAAAEAGRLDIARQLLEAGADASFRAPDGRSALDVAAGNCHHPEMVKLLLEKGARPGPRTLALALRHERYRSYECSRANLEYLLAAGAAVDERGPKGVTPLMVAAEQNDVEAAKLLLRRGAKVNLQGGQYHWSALQYAVFGSVSVRRPDTLPLVQLLLAAGADPNARDQSGFTCLTAMGPWPELAPIREVLVRAGGGR